MNKSTLETYIIRPALKYLDMESDAAVNLLLGTCAQESGMGEHVRQMSGGPAVGIYQIEPNTHKDVFYNYLIYHDDLMKKVGVWQMGQNMTEHLGASIFYQTLIARLLYRRRPEKLPEADDVKGLAKYWKTYYNTPAGHGTVEQFMGSYALHVRNS